MVAGSHYELTLSSALLPPPRLSSLRVSGVAAPMPQLLAILDGGADTVRPTAFERARHPTLDALTQHRGLFYAVSASVAPGSDYAHLAIFGAGAHPRGAFEALGLGMRMGPGDTAFKCVLARRADRVVADRKPRVSDEDGRTLVERLSALLGGREPRVELRHYELHRFALVVGRATAYENDPRRDGAPAVRGADAEMQALVDRADAFLAADPLAAALGVNCVLLRGPAPAARLKLDLPVLVASDAPVVRGIGHCIEGAEVRAVDWEAYAGDRDDEACCRRLREDLGPGLETCGLAVLHFERTDTHSHRGDVEAKARAIELADHVLGNVLRLCAFSQVIVTCDHTTSCDSRQHSIEPVPIAIWRRGCEGAATTRFTERDCADGDLGVVYGHELMAAILDAHRGAQ